MKGFHYLNFDGNAEEAFHFYQKILRGKLDGKINYMREAPGMDLEESEKSRVMHASMVIHEHFKIMVSDILPSMGHQLQVGNNQYISLDLDSKDEGRRVFGALSENGQVEMAFQKTFWGAYFGSLKDQYGISWMVNYDLKPGEE